MERVPARVSGTQNICGYGTCSCQSERYTERMWICKRQFKDRNIFTTGGTMDRECKGTATFGRVGQVFWEVNP